MENLILTLIPQLQNYPYFLVITEMCFAFFFGGFIFSSLWNLVTTLLGGKKS